MRDNLKLVARPEGAYQSFMDNGLVCRTGSENETSAPAASVLLANPKRSPDGRLMYSEHQLQRAESYRSGPLDDLTVDEVRAMTAECLNFFGVWFWNEIPLPCAGLPGLLYREYDRSEEAFELLQLGIEYLSAVVNNERKTMHNRWQEARDLIRSIERRTKKQCEEEYIARHVQLAHEREATIEATPQFVYFIGAASGPIKIGIAVRPIERLKGLQTSHHEQLYILATCDGNTDLERAYHKQFADRRLKGEWFERCPEIEAEIERLNA